LDQFSTGSNSYFDFHNLLTFLPLQGHCLMQNFLSPKLRSSYSHSPNQMFRKIVSLSLPFALAFISSKSANAYQIPTTANGLWSGTNVTTGVGNTIPATKTTPSGIQVRISVAGTGTGILARNNTSLMTSGNNLLPALPTTTNGLQLLTDLSNCPNGSTVLTCSNLGTFSIEFLDPTNTPIQVRNPIVHWSRLGGSKSVTANGVVKSFLQTVILQLTTPNLKFGSVSGTSIAVSPGVNNNIRWAFPSTAPTTAGVCSTTSSDAGCGSTPILEAGGGNVLANRLDFSVSGERTNASINWNELVNGALTVAQDGYFVTVSFEEDYGDAPASFDATIAASHIITDLALGSLVDVENTTVANGGADGATSVASSPRAVSAGADNTGNNGDGLDDDGVTSFPPLTTALSGTTYTVPVALSGASRSGRVCGWIDFNRNGVFDSSTERACGDFAAGATTANLNWTVPAGLTVGNNYVRIRASYDVSGVQNPTGRLSSGEVEDYRIPITQSNQPPTTNDLNSPAQLNPGASVTVPVPSLSGLDPEDGILGSGKTFKIVTLPTNGTLYYDGIPIVAGQTIVNYDPTKLTIDPNDGALTTSFTYAAVDSIGLTDLTPATVRMPFTAPITTVTLSGTVFDDADGSKLQNGTELVTNAGGLNAVLVDSNNKVIATTVVAANGTYSFSNVPANANYTVQITTATAILGDAPPATILPANWLSTGENLNGTPDGIIDSKLSVSVTTNNVVNINFGIEQLPDSLAIAAPSQNNPGGTTAVQVPPLGGTDPEDGVMGSGQTFKIVTLPTNGTLYYNGVAVTTGQTISNYDPTKLTIDPQDGAITLSFTYAAIDRAGQQDPTPATVTMPFTVIAVDPPNLILVKRITAINDVTTQNPNDNTPLNLFVDDITSSKAADDNNSNWLPNYLKGAIDAGKVSSGDKVEYTIYFLSAGGAPVKNLNICDLVPGNTTFFPDGFGTGRGIQLSIGSTLTTLTNVPDGDRAEYFAPNSTPSTNCSGTNSNGAVWVKVVDGTVQLPNAVTPGTPGDSYGFIRFRVKAN
jgi:uncharacterized repeat protein (TIGR01451 family)